MERVLHRFPVYMHSNEFFEKNGQLKYPDNTTDAESLSHVRGTCSLRETWDVQQKRLRLLSQKSIINNTPIHPDLVYDAKYFESSEQVLNLCQRLLELNPCLRLTARECLSDPQFASSE